MAQDKEILAINGVQRHLDHLDDDVDAQQRVIRFVSSRLESRQRRGYDSKMIQPQAQVTNEIHQGQTVSG